jgi:hypothetical protein
MQAAATNVASAAYAMFALLQPISLDELRDAAATHSFPLAETTTPDWFAAAAADDSSLLETAPELLVLAPDLDSTDEVDVTGIDLIHVYAPELQGVEDLEEEPPPPAPPAKPAPAPATPRTSTQIGLLKELSNLDT